MPPHGGWTALLAAWQETNAPEGWRTEIVADAMVVSPPLDNRGSSIADQLNRLLRGVIPDDWAICHVLGMSVGARSELFVPDVVVVARSDLRAGPDHEPVPVQRARLIAEIPSHGSAEIDRTTKRRGYAHAGVPQYLLIDRFDEDGPAVTLFTDPVDGHYRHLVRIPFGEKIRLPEPFALDLDTGEF